MNHRSSLLLLILPLLLAILACSLTADDETPENPTPVPTIQPIGQVSTLAPSATPRATNTTAPTSIPAPSCTVRTDWPTVTVQSGETLSAIARRTGASVNDLVNANCLASADSLQAGQTLRVPVAVPPTVGGVIATVTMAPPLGCTNRWFFSFNTNVTETRCPDVIVSSKASGQDFEGGRVFWYESAAGYTVNQIYVAFNDGGWAVYGDAWNSSLPYEDPAIVAPAGRYEPVAGIGYLWRTQPGLRQKLGWAYEPEQAFTGRRQQPIYVSTSGQIDIYIDYGKRNLVLRLSQPLTGNQVQSWVAAGGY